MDQECERSREAALEFSLGWSRNGGTNIGFTEAVP